MKEVIDFRTWSIVAVTDKAENEDQAYKHCGYCSFTDAFIEIIIIFTILTASLCSIFSLGRLEKTY